MALSQLDADLHVPRLADGIDPERPLHLAADLVRQRPIEQREERLGTWRRQIARRQHLHRQVEPVARHLDELSVLVLARILLVDVDDGGDVARSGFRKAPRHGLPVALHEHEGDDAFEHDDRRDDDDERAGIEALGQDVGEPAADELHVAVWVLANQVPKARSGRGAGGRACHALRTGAGM